MEAWLRPPRTRYRACSPAFSTASSVFGLLLLLCVCVAWFNGRILKLNDVERHSKCCTLFVRKNAPGTATNTLRYLLGRRRRCTRRSCHTPAHSCRTCTPSFQITASVSHLQSHSLPLLTHHTHTHTQFLHRHRPCHTAISFHTVPASYHHSCPLRHATKNTQTHIHTRVAPTDIDHTISCLREVHERSCRTPFM